MAVATEDLRMAKGIAVVATTNTSILGTEGPTTAGADSKTKPTGVGAASEERVSAV